MRLHTSNNQIDTWGLPSETWQWRIKENNADNWTTGPEIVQNIHYTPNKFVSDKDGDMDVFFANASGTWDHNYVAQHLGILNSWSGTNEQVILTDKNKKELETIQPILKQLKSDFSYEKLPTEEITFKITMPCENIHF